MKAKCIWFTGLPCSGKTTISKEILKYFPNSQLLDGDEIRNTPLAKDVGFTPDDRAKHIMRMGQIAKMLVDNGVTAVCSFVSPAKGIREEVKSMFAPSEFVEIYVSTPVEECIRRDVKGMYKKAIEGEIGNFTGVQAPYDAPESPDLMMDTTNMTVQESVDKVLEVANPFSERYPLFIGRWNGVMHNGHDYIIQKKIDECGGAILCVRNVKPDEGNPWTAREVKEMLEYRYKDYPNVTVMIIPDLASVEYGRGVGYGVNEIKVDKEIAGISGTKCRKMIADGDDAWKELVPKEIAEFLDKKYGLT